MIARQSLLLATLAAAFLTGGGMARADTITVTIDKLVFSPATVQAKVGDTIEWVNNGRIAHTATVKGGWDVMIPARKTASLVLDDAGSFNYYCRFHPNMTGSIIVTER
jgi:plastocyanin